MSKCEKPRAIIVDLDSTLANNDHRQKYLDWFYSGNSVMSEAEAWDKFNAGIPEDIPNKWCERIISAFSKTHKIIILTGRGEDVRKTTAAWLYKFLMPCHEMYMRDPSEYGDDSLEYKTRNLEVIMEQYKVELAIDDEKRICKMFHEYGIPTLNVMTDQNIKNDP